jgi:hypothetical protein
MSILRIFSTNASTQLRHKYGNFCPTNPQRFIRLNRAAISFVAASSKRAMHKLT